MDKVFQEMQKIMLIGVTIDILIGLVACVLVGCLLTWAVCERKKIKIFVLSIKDRLTRLANDH